MRGGDFCCSLTCGSAVVTGDAESGSGVTGCDGDAGCESEYAGDGYGECE